MRSGLARRISSRLGNIGGRICRSVDVGANTTSAIGGTAAAKTTVASELRAAVTLGTVASPS